MQVSHPKSRHTKMKSNVDFKKVYDPDGNRLIAVVNLNNMFPIPKSMYAKLSYKDIDKHRTFKDEAEKSKYIALMMKEMKIINSMNIEKSAMRVYENKINNPDNVVSQRCIDFEKMEILAGQYKETE